MESTWARMSSRRLAPSSRTRGGDQRWRTPGELDHWPKQVMTRGGRKQMIEIAEYLRRVANGIPGEHHAVECVCFETSPQCFFVEGAVERDQSADASQNKSESELNRIEAFDKDDDDQRIAFGAAGHLCGHEGDAFDRDLFRDLEFNYSAVFAILKT
jgi:hypothetical protein